MKIGVFWVSRGSVFGLAVSLSQGTEGIPGLVDSDVNHADCWDTSIWSTSSCPDLGALEYHAVPRGRVLYVKRTGQPLVYLDRVLLNDKHKALISEFFDFKAGSALWKVDAHYTTSPVELKSLFDRD